jgi:hypothetical protein
MGKEQLRIVVESVANCQSESFANNNLCASGVMTSASIFRSANSCYYWVNTAGAVHCASVREEIEK